MQNYFALTLNQTLVFLVFMAAGFILCRSRAVSDKLSAVISQLLMNIMLPALCFKTFSVNFTVDNLAKNSTYILIGFLVLSFVLIISFAASRLFSRNRETRSIYLYALAIPNIGYLGYTLIQAVFGDQALAIAMVLMIPQNIFIYTIGVYLLGNDKKLSLKTLFNPIMISMLLGATVGLTGLQLPGFIISACSSAAACMTPLAMIMTGFVLARVPFKSLVTGCKPYLISLIRLVLIPGLTFVGLRLLSVDSSVILTATALELMPCGLNVVVFPEARGGDSRTGAQTCFVSTVLCMITIPVFFMLLTTIL